MLEHNIIVPAVQRPDVTFPDAGGAGLDLARILIVAAVLLALMALAGTAIRRHLQRKDEI
jgi:hypothetical protein